MYENIYGESSLKHVFRDSIFENPPNEKCAWVGSEKAKVFLLNDFRWSEDLIPWHDMLLLLEGETIKLAAPKNIYIEDIVISTDAAIFATSKSPIKRIGSYNASNDRVMSFAINFLPKSRKICFLTQDVLKN